METHKKKAKKLGALLIFVDESGFSLSPTLGPTWAEVGKPTVLCETFTRCSNQSGLGFISVLPTGRKMKFHFTIMDGSCVTEDFVFWLTQLHHHFRKKVIVVWDRLSAHLSAQSFFEREHPAWFLFEYFPPYSPELNPVEQCWHWMKDVFLVNFVPKDNPELYVKVLEAAQNINRDPKLLPAFFFHARLRF